MANGAEESVEPNLMQTLNLLQLARQGDKQALNRLCALFGPRLAAVVRMRLGSRLRAKMETMDVVQDALLAALPHLEVKQFESGGALFHWLTKLLENRIRDMADHYAAGKRDAARERPLETPAAGGDTAYGPLANMATWGTPSQVVSGREEIERLEAAVDKLPDDQREALILVRYEGMSMAEAGAVMERSPDAVRMLVSRAIVKLGQLLGAFDATD